MAKRSSPVRSVPVGVAGARTDPVELETTDLGIPPGQIYVSAAQLAHRFGVGVRWVSAHKLQLGATAISDSANSKLRYYLPTADAYMRGRTLTPSEKRRRPRAKRGSGGGGEGLIQFV